MTTNDQRVGSPIRRAWWISLSLLALAACGALNNQHVATTDTGSVMSAGKPADHLNKASPAPATGAPAPAMGMAGMAAEPIARLPRTLPDTERYADVDPNPVQLVSEHPVSTFSIDVDTASYSNVRRFLKDGVLPPRDAVRIEEMVNYFDYAYPLPDDRTAPFAASVAVMPTPWNTGTKLLHIGVKGFDIARQERPRANLVFLVDVSGSMQPPEKLPLVKQSLRQLVETLAKDDSVAIVAYAGHAGTVLEPTPGSDKGKILAAIDTLESGGSTAGGEGIRQAYALAVRNLDKRAVNRVILATDGDFNVGITDPERLEDFVARKRETGIYLSVLGFGGGNLNDLLMQKLAQAGNGNAAYIDSLMEGRKVLVEEASSTLFPIANDVKIQVEFNPAVVAEYRLIGYETRMLRREDFSNDAVDAGEIGSGHAVTALYEVTPVDSPARLVEPLRYGAAAAVKEKSGAAEYAFLRIRYKLPGETASRLIERPITPADGYTLEAAPKETRFAVAVATFGELLRGDPYLKAFRYEDVLALAQPARGEDPFGYRAEFVQLVRMAGASQAQAARP